MNEKVKYARRLSEIQPFRVMKLLARANEHVRFTYAQDLARLSTALDRIERALKGTRSH